MSITDNTHPIEPSPPHTIILKTDFPPSSWDTFELIQWSSNAFLGPPSSRLYTFPSFRMVLNLKSDVWQSLKTFRILKMTYFKYYLYQYLDPLIGIQFTYLLRSSFPTLPPDLGLTKTTKWSFDILIINLYAKNILISVYSLLF